MKTNLENQNNNLVALTNFDSTAMNAPTHALITHVELKNGKVAPIITMFNCSEIDFEEVNIGVTTTLSRQNKFNGGFISRVSKLYRLKKGEIELITEFQKHYYNPQNVPN